MPCTVCFFFNDTATTEIYTLSLHDALPILWWRSSAVTTAAPPGGSTARASCSGRHRRRPGSGPAAVPSRTRSEEHTSELQSPCNLVCRLLLEKKKTVDSYACIGVTAWHPRT